MFRFLYFFLIISSHALAAGKWDYGISSLGRGIYREPIESFLNPNNQIVEIPQWSFEGDLRPSFVYEQGAHKLRIDPRIILVSDPQSYRYVTHGLNDSEVFFNELFYQVDFKDHQLVLGLQNYQWGPAEILSPSNPMFRFLPEQRSLFFQQRGRNILRWNYSIAPSWTMVTMIELSKNGIPFPRKDQHFSHNGLVKLEKGFEKSSDYVGGVVGITPSGERFIGEYGAYSLTDEISFYLDARHQYQSNNFYLNQNSSFEVFEKQKAHDEKIYTLSTVGVRHESRVDIRLEYIYNELGLTEREWKKGKRTLTTLGPNLGKNFKRFFLSGRELNKKHYGHLSLRVPDLGPKAQYTLFLRHFNSLQDSSGISQFQMDRITGENSNLYLELSHFSGASDKDFSSIIRNEISLGFRTSY